MKVTVPYKEIEAFYEANEHALRRLGLAVEQLIVEGRDRKDSPVPIYVTKMRIKSPESVYLKNKRKAYKNLNEITDLIGLRALCLFEQDILPTFQYMAGLFMGLARPSDGTPTEFNLAEIKFFNWPDKVWRDSYGDCIRRVFEENRIKEFQFETTAENLQQIHFSAGNKSKGHHFQFELVEKRTGYKSIHFVVKKGVHFFEVQLRTLLQDVWGELEHSLSYKQGFVHPHISNNFQLFSRELQAKDELMSHLRDIRDKESAVDGYMASTAAPSYWLDFDLALVQNVFDKPHLQEKNREYCELCNSYNKHQSDQAHVANQIATQLSVIDGMLTDRKNEQCVAHWLGMEQAFVRSCNRDHKGAWAIYKQELARDEFPYSRWAVYYRRGELLISNGEIEQALIQFDLCETAIPTGDNPKIADKELYRVNTKLAFIYWSLGPEYIDIAAQKIDTAEQHFGKITDRELVSRSQPSLVNNLCYYHLEYWLETKRSSQSGRRIFDEHAEAKRRFEVLAETVKKSPETASSNAYDTLSWFCYNSYLDLRSNDDDAKRKEGLGYLSTAKEYIDSATQKQNRGVSLLTSANLQRRHMQEIMIEFDRAVGLGLLPKKKEPYGS